MKAAYTQQRMFFYVIIANQSHPQLGYDNRIFAGYSCQRSWYYSCFRNCFPRL